MRLYDLFNPIEEPKIVREFLLSGAITSAVVATYSLGAGVLGAGLPAFVDAAIFAIVAWRVARASRAWSVIGLSWFVVEKFTVFIFSTDARHSAGAWFFAFLFACGFIAGIRGAFASRELAQDDNPYNLY